MNGNAITFFVPGVPKPSGSKRGFYVPKLKRVVITDDNRNSRDWKTDVQQAALKVYTQEFSRPLIEGPLKLEVTFVFPRPKSHFRVNGALRDSAPKDFIGRPDITKLLRAVEDALNKVVWNDDSQIILQIACKRYGPTPGALITITKIEDSEAIRQEVNQELKLEIISNAEIFSYFEFLKSKGFGHLKYHGIKCSCELCCSALRIYREQKV